MSKELDEINAIIKKNLPAQVGENLQVVLAKAQSDAKDLDTLNIKHNKLVTEKNKVDKKLLKQEELETKIHQLSVDRTKFEREQRDAKVKELEYKLVEAERRADTIHGYTETLVKNTLVRKSVFGNNNTMGYSDSNGQWQDPRGESTDHNETTTEE